MNEKNSAQAGSSWVAIVLLILAGEAIFALPFHVARFFRPTLLAALELTQTELGVLQSAYGLAAMLSYFPGGLLADRYSSRALLSLSLIATAAGGLYFASLPSYGGLLILHVYWGVTTILLFWSPLIRATRIWGTPKTQGRAFGLLDGGRGALAALLATVGVSLLTSGDQEAVSSATLRLDLSRVILMYTAATATLAGLVWWGLRGAKKSSSTFPNLRKRRSEDWKQLRYSRLLAHAVVIVCAYCTYKGTDFYATYATSVFGFTEFEGARVAAVGIWIRPIAALSAGLLADRFSAQRLTLLSFASLVIVCGLAASLGTRFTAPALLWGVVITTGALVYAFRALYYALLEEGHVPLATTGTAVGVISFIGYSPDFFFPALSGAVVDSAPGHSGYVRLFALLLGFAVLGCFATLRLRKAAPETHPAISSE